MTESQNKSTENPQPQTQPQPRARMSLNLHADDMAELKALASAEHATVHEAIRRAIHTRWRLHTAQNPQLKYPTLEPDQLPETAHIALIGDLTGRITLLETW